MDSQGKSARKDERTERLFKEALLSSCHVGLRNLIQAAVINIFRSLNGVLEAMSIH